MNRAANYEVKAICSFCSCSNTNRVQTHDIRFETFWSYSLNARLGSKAYVSMYTFIYNWSYYWLSKFKGFTDIKFKVWLNCLSPKLEINYKSSLNSSPTLKIQFQWKHVDVQLDPSWLQYWTWTLAMIGDHYMKNSIVKKTCFDLWKSVCYSEHKERFPKLQLMWMNHCDISMRIADSVVGGKITASTSCNINHCKAYVYLTPY